MNVALKNKFAAQYANNYVETAVTEASPHKLVEMLYEGAIKNLRIAKVFFEQHNFEKKSVHVNKALSIVTALKAGVDIDKGGDVAENLFELYDYCHRGIFKASAENDTAKLDEVVDVLESLEQAWKSMPDQYKKATKEQIDTIGE